MEEKLDFSLPKKKQRGPATNRILIILLVILIVLSAFNLASKPKRGQSPDVAGGSLTPEQTRQLAAKLAQRNLHQRAAKVWEDYLAAGTLTDSERARTLFQIGTLLERASLYDQAIEYFYRSEAVAELDELKPQISAHIKDCFEKLGKFSALRYEMMDRTSLDAAPPAGAKVVAEIGAEKITRADLDVAIENDIDNQLEPMAAFMTTEQLNEQKKRILEQYKDPQAKQQYLQSWLAQEVLYRQALEDGLAGKPEAKKLINHLTRSALSQLLMNNELASKIHITETDLQTFYSANKDDYVEPARAAIRHILVDDEQQAKELIGRIKKGEDFSELATQFTKEKGGRIDAEVQKGAHVSGIGPYDELNEKIFAVDPPNVLDEPFKTEKGFEIVKVETITPERQKSLDEVRQHVMSTLANQKRQDVQRDYIEQMMDKYNVIVHTSVLGGKENNESEERPVEKAR
jgi:parvulin-like peptidyl-prolyl isomerase